MRRKRTFKDPIFVETEAKAKYGLETFFLEDLSQFDQITLFKSAEVIVGIHGAGLTNILWCKANTRVFEIFALNEIAMQQKGLTMYAKLAETLNLDYQPVYGQNSNRWKDIDIEFPFSAIDKFL
jgi:capsular polysaccharide biosynthesis protein